MLFLPVDILVSRFLAVVLEAKRAQERQVTYAGKMMQFALNGLLFINDDINEQIKR